MLDSAYANVDALSTELHATKLQLSSKCEAIKILTQRLEETKKEAEQFKLMAEQLQERYRSLKQTLGSDVSSSPSVNCPPRKAFINLKVKLNESEMHNRILETELNNIRRRNSELLNDIAVLQKSCARSQPEAFENSSNEKKSFSAQERESLIAQLELKTMECVRLKRDLEICNDEKQELLLELNVRKESLLLDSFDKSAEGDVESILRENKVLSRQVIKLEAEKRLLAQSLAKYNECDGPNKSQQLSGSFSSLVNDFENDPVDNEVPRLGDEVCSNEDLCRAASEGTVMDKPPGGP